MDTKKTAITIMVGKNHGGRNSKRDVMVDLGMFYSLLRIHIMHVNICFVFPCVCPGKSKMPLHSVGS